MSWDFTNDRSICTQIVEAIQRGILSGLYPPGSSVPSVRTLALEAGVNPNTMQKALVELETQGLLHTQRTSGRTVTTDEKLIMALKKAVASKHIENYFDGMRSLGFEREEAAGMLMAHAQKPCSGADTGFGAQSPDARPGSGMPDPDVRTDSGAHNPDKAKEAN